MYYLIRYCIKAKARPSAQDNVDMTDFYDDDYDLDDDYDDYDEDEDDDEGADDTDDSGTGKVGQEIHQLGLSNLISGGLILVTGEGF